MTTRHGSRSTTRRIDDPAQALAVLAEAALDRKPVTGWTHNFYRYPARFSPSFAAAAINGFSKPGDLVLDPYMGGGTAVLEGVAAGRHVVGNDLNSLAAFITKVKITGLAPAEALAMRRWAANDVPSFTYDRPLEELVEFIDSDKTRNLSLVKARFIKKGVAAALASIVELPTRNAQDFARCAVLKVGQWALDGRERHTPLPDFRERLTSTTGEMLESLTIFAAHVKRAGGRATILNGDAAELDQAEVFQTKGKRVALVVTSPPYPGVHVLYHRWQVDGRRETPAPYWIAGCDDGQGASFYNFGDRRETAADKYFRTSLGTLLAIRRVMRDGGYMVQIVAFNRPEAQLPRYLDNMKAAGFAELSIDGTNAMADRRIWREVPHRKWHATLNGKTHSSNEVVLIHRAV
jgi:DNA modification methylase